MNAKLRILLVMLPALMLATSAGAQNLDAEFATPDSFKEQPTAGIWTNVTVVVTGDWEYAGVAVEWVGGGEALRVTRPDGAARNMDSDQILKVLDAKGHDITSQVAAGRRRGDQPALTGRDSGHTVAMSDSGRVTTPTLAGPPPPPVFRFALDAGIGYATHAGTWFAGLDDGRNYQLGLRVTTENDVFVRVLYRNQNLGQQTEEVYIDGLGTVNFTADFSLREYQFLLGKIGRMVEKESLRSFGYLEFGLSVMDHRAVTTDLGGSTTSITKAGLVLQGGVMFVVDRHVAVDLSVGATWKSSLLGDDGGGLLMGAHAGLALLF